MRFHKLLLAGLGLVLACTTREKARELTFDFEYTVIFNDEGPLQAWVPLPRNDPFQTITKLRINTSLDYSIVADTLYGNRMVYVNTQLVGLDSLSVTFRAHRIEATSIPSDLSPRERGLHMAAYRLVPLETRFDSIADSIEARPGDFGRGAYDYILEHMTYDKSGEGWGRGDANYACDVGKGNCTDYHSLFNAVVRSRGVPARFHIGFPIPDGREGPVNGYHCWSEFYWDGKWVPVDISEADKNPLRQDYYYGRLDERRVDFSIGRDIPLPLGKPDDVVNFFIYPYVKIDQRVTRNYATRFTFREAMAPGAAKSDLLR